MIRRIKNSLIYHLTRVAVILTGQIPDRFSRSAGLFIGAIAHSVARRERNLARKQLAAAFRRPENSPSIELLSRGVFLSLGRSVVELCRLLKNQDKLPPTIIPDASRECLTRALSKGKGVVFVTGHLGNWELMAFRLALEGFPISTVAKESYDLRFTKMIDNFRSGAGVKAIYRGKPGAVTAMLRALKQNRVLGLLIDQDTDVPSEFVTFFGRSAATPIGAATLAIRSGAPAVVGTIRRQGRDGHLIEITDCATTSNPIETTEAFTRELENRIRKSPTEWVWFHRRWKTRPNEEK